MIQITMRAQPKHKELTKVINSKAASRVGTATTTEGRLSELERRVGETIAPAVTATANATATLNQQVATIGTAVNALDGRVDTLEQEAATPP